LGLPLKQIDCFDDIEKYRHISNAIKHGAGYSAKQVENECPALLGFAHDPKIGGWSGLFCIYYRTISTPMLNDEIAITEADILDYLRCTKQFLKFFSSSTFTCDGELCLDIRNTNT